MRSWWTSNKYLTEINRFLQDSARVFIRYGVKEPVDVFMGRHTELGELHRSLQRTQSRSNRNVRSPMTCVTGLGGIGKTQLAREYIKQYSRNYDNNVIWINAESDGSLHREFTTLAKDRLNIPATDVYRKEKDINSLVAEAYLFFANRKSLFVFDNADATENLPDFLPLKSLPPDARTPHILITSRRNKWVGDVDVVALGKFTTEEATEFVRKGLGLDEKNDAMNRSIIRLVDVLQRFPLAIQQAISYIRNQSLTSDVSIDEYLQTYEQSKQVLLDWKLVTKDMSNDYEGITYTTWKITIEKIGATRRGKLALEILDVVAHLACNDIRREMFSTLALGDDRILRAAVRKLVNFSMINGEQRQSILHVHELVQQVTRLEQLIHGTEAAVLQKTWRLLKHDLPVGYAPEEYSKKGHIFPHCEAILSRFDGAQENQHGHSKMKDDDVVHGLLEISRMFVYSGHFDRSQKINERIIRFEEEHRRLDDSSLISRLEYLGTWYIYLNDPQNAKRSFKRVLALREQRYSRDHVAIVETLVTLSDIYEAVSDYQKQKEFIERALDIVEKQDPSNHLEISHLSHKLSFAHGHLGDHQKQNELFKRTLAIAQKHQPRVLFEFERHLMMLLKDQIPTTNHFSVCRWHPYKPETFWRIHSMKHYYGDTHVQSGIIYSSLKNREIQKKLLARAVEIMDNLFGTYYFGVPAKLVTLGIANGFLCDSPTKYSLVRDVEESREPNDMSCMKFVDTLLNQLVITYAKLRDGHDQEERLGLDLDETENNYELDHFQIGHILVGLGVCPKPSGKLEPWETVLISYGNYWRRGHKN